MRVSPDNRFLSRPKSLLSRQRPNPGRGRQPGGLVAAQYLELLGPRRVDVWVVFIPVMELLRNHFLRKTQSSFLSETPGPAKQTKCSWCWQSPECPWFSGGEQGDRPTWGEARTQEVSGDAWLTDGLGRADRRVQAEGFRGETRTRSVGTAGTPAPGFPRHQLRGWAAEAGSGHSG